MKHVIAALLVLGSASQAMADGFVCTTVDGDLAVKVYNKTAPQEGTRNGAVLVLSDPAVQHGRKTIARFTADNGLLENETARYVADVDLRFADSRRKGELIVVNGRGTKLGQLDQIIVDVDFTYTQPLKDGELTRGLISLVKRDGETLEADLECVRYLKN